MTGSEPSAPVFVLEPLDCPTCGAAVAAEGEDVVYYCTACRNGYVFAGGGLVPTEVSFVAAANLAAEAYRPFWLLPAQIRILRREARGGGFAGLLELFTGGEGDAAEAPGTFAVPAFHAPLPSITAMTRAYTRELPQLGERLGERLLGGRYGVADAEKLARYALLESEIGRPDTLLELEYEIEFGTARLLGVPFRREGDGWVDALFGISC